MVRATIAGDDFLVSRSVNASPNHHSLSHEVKALPMILVDFQRFVFDFLFHSVVNDGDDDDDFVVDTCKRMRE
jgi:hypothetical protein